MTITVIDFEEGREVEVYHSLDRIGEITPGRSIWIDVQSDDLVELTELAAMFGFHELTVEDCLTPGHFPKLDDYGSYLFILLRAMKSWSDVEQVWEEDDEIPQPEGGNGKEERGSYTRKVALFLAQNLIVTFRRNEVAWLDAIVRQAQQRPDQILGEGTEGVAHRVIDVLVDRFMRSLGFFENVIDEFEDVALEQPDEFEVTDIFEIKRDLVYIRQIARNQRSIISRLASDSTLIQDTQRRRYYKDIDDHSVDIVRMLDKQMQAVLSIRDSYLALANVRLGDTMRVLTVITTIVAPMNIVVGIYGMNFTVIPMLNDPYGFWIILLLMLLLGVIMVAFFRKKRWI